MKRVQVEPHLSVTGACSAEWVPIKPKTDAAFLYALIHVLLHEAPRERLDLPFLRRAPRRPTWSAPHGYYLRDPASGKPLVWDELQRRAVPHDTPGMRRGAGGPLARRRGRDRRRRRACWPKAGSRAPGVHTLVEHMAGYSPNGRSRVCDVPAATMRRIAHEYLDHACVGQTHRDRRRRPCRYRPVAVSLGKTVNNGWGGYECCWARTMLARWSARSRCRAARIGTTVRLVRPMSERLQSVKPGPDGFMATR
jgi:phenylacetyl-CoA:acceptor oxidoreductase